jgi:peptide/nickel transport system ATP-binding protein
LAPTPGRPLPEVAMTGGYPNPLDPPPGCPFHPRCPEAMAVCRTTHPLPSPRIGGGRVECHLYAG